MKAYCYIITAHLDPFLCRFLNFPLRGSMKVYLTGLNISKCHICMLLPFAEITFKLREMEKLSLFDNCPDLHFVPFDFISP